jgi:hypothetical protein
MSKTVLLLLVANLFTIALLFQSQEKHLRRRVLALHTERAQEIAHLNTLKAHWQKIVADSPTYRDGYLQLAAIEYKLKNQISSKSYLQKAMEIDPNFELPITLSFLQPLVSLR